MRGANHGGGFLLVSCGVLGKQQHQGYWGVKKKKGSTEEVMVYDLYQSSATDDGEEKRACCKVKASHPADGEMYFSFLGQPHKAQSIDRETVDEGKAVKHTHTYGRMDGPNDGPGGTGQPRFYCEFY